MFTSAAASGAYSIGDWCVCLSWSVSSNFFSNLHSHTIYVPICKNCGTAFQNIKFKIFGHFFFKFGLSRWNSL